MACQHDQRIGQALQGGERRFGDAHGNALQRLLDGVQRVVEFLGGTGGVATDLKPEFLELLFQLLDAGPALIEEGNKFDAAFTKELHGQRRLFCAIGHGGEGIGQIEQYLLGGAQLTGGIFDGDAEAAEGLDLLLRSAGRFDHGGREFLHALGQPLEGHAGLLGDGLEQRQRLHRDAGLLRQLGEIVSGIHGRLAGSHQCTHRERSPHRGQQAIDRLSGRGDVL